MSFMAGLALAYLKISVVAVVIVAVIWVIAKISVALHQPQDDPADED